MRFVHTSDWHLGRTFGGQSLHDQQEAFLTWLVELVRAEAAELVVVAGDVYDRAIPSAESVSLFGRALGELRAAGAQVVVIAGNHDSAERLSAYDDLTDLAGVYLRGGYPRAGQVVHLEASDGPLDVVPLPFLEPALAPADAPSDDAAAPTERPTHRAVLERAVGTARQMLRAPRSVAVAHAFVAGATSSESERTLSVGGGGLVPASVFAEFSYVALGHLHKPQALDPTVRYSGSPLAYSFGEQQPKQVLVVDLDPTGATEVRQVPVGPGRRVATVRGPIEQLLSDDRHTGAEGCWVRAVLTDPGYVLDAKARLQRRFPHVIEVVLDPQISGADTAARERVRGADRGRSPLHRAVGFWHAITGQQPTRSITTALAAALDEARLALGDSGRHLDELGATEAVEGMLAGYHVPGELADADAPQPPLDDALAVTPGTGTGTGTPRVPHEQLADATAGPARRRGKRARSAPVDAPTLFDDADTGERWGHAS